MIDILYTLIYIIPMVLTAAVTALQCFIETDSLQKPNAPIWFMLLAAVLFTVIINVRNKLRIIISGSILALLLGLFLVTDAEIRTEWYSANSWILPAFLLSAAVMVLGGYYAPDALCQACGYDTACGYTNQLLLDTDNR